ncbi:Hermansky-Pudlak syndrome 3 protein [Pelomyxa schiedti]|nr:Hermansky-Pudlak syndrome 3 protein [Pelomyxa schiedti]
MKWFNVAVLDDQKVISVPQEPLLLMTAVDDEILILATKTPDKKKTVINGFLVTGGEPTLKVAFELVDRSLRAVVHLPQPDCIITIEKANPESEINVVRLYFNWRAAHHAVNSSPRVVELPLHSSATTIAVCTSSCRLAVATEEDISIWAAPNDNSESVNALPLERIVQIDCPLVTSLALFESYLGFSFGEEIVIVSLQIIQNTSPQGAPPSCTDHLDTILSPTRVKPVTQEDVFTPQEDEYIAELKFDSHGKYDPQSHVSTLSVWKTPNNQFEILGPKPNIGYILHFDSSHHTLNSIQTMLHSRYESPIHTIQFLPEYSEIQDTGKATKHTAADSITPLVHISSMRCVVCTGYTARLYDVQHPTVMCSYEFPEETIHCYTDQSFMYSITEEKLQFCTLRTSTGKAVYGAHPPCMISMKPFPRAKKIIVISDHLILLTYSSTEPETPQKRTFGRQKSAPLAPPQVNWGIYLLSAKNTASLYEDIIQLANRHKCGALSLVQQPQPQQLPSQHTHATATTTTHSDEASVGAEYFWLILEGHFLLQTKLMRLHTQLHKVLVSRKIDLAAKLALQHEIKIYQGQLRKSSGILGDYYFDVAKNYFQAAQCYSTSERKLADIVCKFCQTPEAGSTLTARNFHRGDVQAALVQYLDSILLDPKMSDTEEDETTSNYILQHYARYAPHRLSTIVLDSWLSTCSQHSALLLLQHIGTTGNTSLSRSQAPRTQPPTSTPSGTMSLPPSLNELSPKDYFAKSLLHLDVNQLEEAQFCMTCIDPDNLITFCEDNAALLGSPNPDAQEFVQPPLPRLLRLVAPYVLLELAVKLGPDKITYMSLMKNDDRITRQWTKSTRRQTMPLESLPSLPLDYQEDCFLLMCYFEAFLKELIPNTNVPRDKAEISVKLGSLYLHHVNSNHKAQCPLPLETIKSVSDQVNQGTFFKKWLNFHHTTFMERPVWLQVLPPFEDPAYVPFAEHALNYDYFYVAKLQGLVISGHILDSAWLCLPLLAQLQDTAGQLEPFVLNYLVALYYLLMPLSSKYTPVESISAMVYTFPGISLEFGQQFCKQDEHWKVLLNTLISIISDTKPPKLPPFYAPPTPSPHLAMSPKLPILQASTSPTTNTQSAAETKTPTHYSHDKTNVHNVYSKILEFLAATMDTATFVTMLPPNGNLAYFLPYIEVAFQKKAASRLTQQMHQQLTNNTP